MPIYLLEARQLIDAAMKEGEDRGMAPLSVCVLDSGGHVQAFARADGASMLRFEIAKGKAYGALAVGKGSRWLNAQAQARPHFLEGLSAVSGGQIVPVPGGGADQGNRRDVAGCGGHYRRQFGQ